jgi:hypothetical protein
MSEGEQVLERYLQALHFPEVSGFEVLEILDVRSSLAAREGELNAEQRTRLEAADSVFLRDVPMLYETVAALGDLRDRRRRAAAPCSHWWWYLEKLAQRESAQA